MYDQTAAYMNIKKGLHWNMPLEQNEKSLLAQAYQREKEQLFLDCAEKLPFKARENLEDGKEQHCFFCIFFISFYSYFSSTAFPLLMLPHFFHVFNKSREFLIQVAILETSATQSAVPSTCSVGLCTANQICWKRFNLRGCTWPKPWNTDQEETIQDDSLWRQRCT